MLYQKNKTIQNKTHPLLFIQTIAYPIPIYNLPSPELLICSTPFCPLSNCFFTWGQSYIFLKRQSNQVTCLSPPHAWFSLIVFHYKLASKLFKMTVGFTWASPQLPLYFSLLLDLLCWIQALWPQFSASHFSIFFFNHWTFAQSILFSRYALELSHL